LLDGLFEHTYKVAQTLDLHIWGWFFKQASDRATGSRHP